MMDKMLELAASNAMAIGATVLAPQGLLFRRPIDVVRARSLSVDNKRTILAAWALDFYAIESKPAFVTVEGHRSRFRSMRFSLPSENLSSVHYQR